MAITLRLIKGSELTFVEVDDNFKSVFYSSSLDGNELKLFYFPGNTSQSIDLTPFASDFPFTGSAQITGSLEVVGPTLIGSANTPSLNDTVQITATGNGNVVYNVPTSSYEGAFFHYTAHSSSNARAGTIVSTWIPGTSNVVFNETTTNDIGSTSDVNFTTILTGANMALTASVGSGTWTIKTIISTI